MVVSLVAHAKCQGTTMTSATALPLLSVDSDLNVFNSMQHILLRPVQLRWRISYVSSLMSKDRRVEEQ